jgi:heme-degrading monooxygenase HmoA
VIFEADGLGEVRQREALGVIEGLLRTIVCKQPGFLGSHVHLSTDGDKIVHYQQWSSSDAFLAFKSGPAKEIGAKIAPYGLTAKIYDIAYSQFPA